MAMSITMTMTSMIRMVVDDGDGDDDERRPLSSTTSGSRARTHRGEGENFVCLVRRSHRTRTARRTRRGGGEGAGGLRLNSLRDHQFHPQTPEEAEILGAHITNFRADGGGGEERDGDCGDGVVCGGEGLEDPPLRVSEGASE